MAGNSWVLVQGHEYTNKYLTHFDYDPKNSSADSNPYHYMDNFLNTIKVILCTIFKLNSKGKQLNTV